MAIAFFQILRHCRRDASDAAAEPWHRRRPLAVENSRALFFLLIDHATNSLQRSRPNCSAVFHRGCVGVSLILRVRSGEKRRGREGRRYSLLLHRRVRVKINYTVSMQFFPPRLILESSLRNLRAPRAHILIQRNTRAGRCLLHAVRAAHKAKRIRTQLRKNTGHLHNEGFLVCAEQRAALFVRVEADIGGARQQSAS